MTDESPGSLTALVEQSFDNPEELITALEAGLAAEETLDHQFATEDPGLVRYKVLMRLAEAYEGLPQGDRADHLEKALSALDQAGNSASLKDSPLLQVQLQHHLGRVYFSRLRGDRAKNLEQ